jgi:cytochrome c oxidase cbb3-type subunit 1
MLYILSMWAAGVSQSLLWLSLDQNGEVQYSFVEVMRAISPYYALRLLGGVLFLAGALLMAVNLVKTFAGARTAIARVPPPIAVAPQAAAS